MSQRIARMLDEPEQLVTKLINELEAKNGYPSHDARYLAENTQKIRLKMINLGLDPNDTTPQELYHALMVRFERDSRSFEADFNANQTNYDQMNTTVVKLITNSLDLPTQWGLKSKSAKQALQANPPKKLMKYMGYRSVASMLKRENVCELCLAASVIESKVWQKNLLKYISHMDQTDFEMRPVKLLVMGETNWGKINCSEYAVYDALMGTAALWPSETLKSAPLLTMILLLIESFIPQINIKPGPDLVKMNMVMWWVDMDHLIAELGDEHVSLNVKDCALSAWYKNIFEERSLDHGRQSFWQELLSRYQNRPPIEAQFENSLSGIVANLRTAVPQPSLEFAEEFDG